MIEVNSNETVVMKRHVVVKKLAAFSHQISPEY